jgi:hypothetical protein
MSYAQQSSLTLRAESESEPVPTPVQALEPIIEKIHQDAQIRQLHIMAWAFVLWYCTMIGFTAIVAYMLDHP